MGLFVLYGAALRFHFKKSALQKSKYKPNKSETYLCYK